MTIKYRIIGLLLVGCLIVSLLSSRALAATGLIYITPGSSSLQVGGSETVALRINPGTTVDGVQATVSYDPSVLQITGVDTSGSPFSVQLQKSAGGGTVNLSLGNLSGGVSSDALIANIGFTALAAGNSGLTISNANATSLGAYTNPGTSSGSISVSAPAAAPPSSGSSGGSSSSKSTAKQTTTATTDTTTDTTTTPATVSPVTAIHLTSKVSSTSYTTATLQVTSNQAVSFYAQYGTDASHLDSKTSSSSPDVKGTVTLGDTTALTPGTQYYYQVVGQSADGTLTTLPVQQLITTGFTVKVTVLDDHNNLVTHRVVSLHSRVETTTTDGNGVATFTNVAPGVHHVEYETASHQSYSAVVYVQDNLPTPVKGKTSAASAQTAAVVLPVVAASSQLPIWQTALMVLGGLLIIGLLLEIYRMLQHSRRAHQAAASNAKPVPLVTRKSVVPNTKSLVSNKEFKQLPPVPKVTAKDKAK